MNWLGWMATVLVPIASVVATAWVAVKNKSIDAETKREDRRHELALELTKRMWDAKRDALEAIIDVATRIRRQCQPLRTGADDAATQRARIVRTMALQRKTLSAKGGRGALVTWAEEPARAVIEELLDQIDAELEQHAFALSRLEAIDHLRKSATDGLEIKLGKGNQVGLPVDDFNNLKFLSDNQIEAENELGKRSKLDIAHISERVRPGDTRGTPRSSGPVWAGPLQLRTAARNAKGVSHVDMWERLAAAQEKLDRALVLRRILDRAARGSALSDWTALNDWSLKRQLPDAGSSLAMDDDGYLPELGGMFVSETAVYPAMSAAGNLAAAAEVVNRWHLPDDRGRLNMHTVAVMTGCRVALETAALTVWAIGPENRDLRQKRCAGLVFRENQNQRGFINCERKINRATGDTERLASLEQSCVGFEKEDAIVKQAPKVTVPNSTQLVKDAAQWIQDSPPPHAGDLLGGRAGFAVLAESVYNLTSSFVHGFKWATWYVRKERELLGVVADSFAAAVIMTESAVALFEAQAQNPTGTEREILYPDLLVPTIDKWSQRYAGGA